MSIDAFRKAAAKDSEFKGQNADVEKYSRNNSWLVNAGAWGVLLLICLAGYFIFF
ncbi:hypothetical protein [Clostridium tunisiense]|uniref:hypothetical protein n=1 Tax=Clostridium tunisiense TaxID=219748 RepID=UPI000305E7B9|nr:hypothetical protein [Clostridium tunisiense]